MLHGHSKHYVSQKYNVTEVLCLPLSEKGCEKLLVCASNSAKKQGNAKSNVGIQLIINIANTSQLSNVYQGNISALAQAIGCCFCSAKVLNAVRNN